MKNRLRIFTLFVLSTAFPAFPACNPDHGPTISGTDTPGPEPSPEPDTIGNRLRITVGPVAFMGTLAGNASALAFKELLPLTVSMSELNGNEKYYFLPNHLPSAALNPGIVRSGDLMLFGSDCMVLFYKSFSTSYSYTLLGHMDNAYGLEQAAGTGTVSVTFELEE